MFYMQTHFHKYPRLYFYLEIQTDEGTRQCTVHIFANEFDQGLINDSGYLQVLEHYGLAVVDFLAEEVILNDGLH